VVPVVKVLRLDCRSRFLQVLLPEPNHRIRCLQIPVLEFDCGIRFFQVPVPDPIVGSGSFRLCFRNPGNTGEEVVPVAVFNSGSAKNWNRLT